MLQTSIPKAGRILVVILLTLLAGPSSVHGQSGFALEVSGGVGIPGFTDWASPRLVGPAASVGVSGDLSDTWGWVLTARYNRFAFRQERGETTNRFESEPPGDVVVVTTSDLEGGLYAMFSAILGARVEISESARSRSYLTAGLVAGYTRQEEATVEQTVAENGTVTQSGPALWIGEHGDPAIGLTARLGVARRFSETLDWFGEVGYEVALTPNDSFPDNPDFLLAQIGLRVRV